MTHVSDCFRHEATLNELLRDPIVELMMSSDGVASDDVRALFRNVARKDEALRSHRESFC